MSEAQAAQPKRQAQADRVVRHAAPSRVMHWLNAATVLVLLGTAFLPIIGLTFPWVTVHWIAGLVLLVVVLLHTVRALLWQDLKSMWIGAADLRDCAALARWSLRLSAAPPPRPGKYSLAQKLIHHLFAVTILATLVTGLAMLMRIDTPWWRRNPYWLEESTWGVIYVLHGFAALCLVTMVIAHVYFALRPEKLHFTRSMIFGWITRREYRTHHDEKRWQVKP